MIRLLTKRLKSCQLSQTKAFSQNMVLVESGACEIAFLEHLRRGRRVRDKRSGPRGLAFGSNLNCARLTGTGRSYSWGWHTDLHDVGRWSEFSSCTVRTGTWYVPPQTTQHTTSKIHQTEKQPTSDNRHAKKSLKQKPSFTLPFILSSL